MRELLRNHLRRWDMTTSSPGARRAPVAPPPQASGARPRGGGIQGDQDSWAGSAKNSAQTPGRPSRARAAVGGLIAASGRRHDDRDLRAGHASARHGNAIAAEKKPTNFRMTPVQR